MLSVLEVARKAVEGSIARETALTLLARSLGEVAACLDDAKQRRSRLIGRSELCESVRFELGLYIKLFEEALDYAKQDPSK